MRFGRATASTVMNRHDSFDICMETTTLHAHFEGRPTNRLRKSCGSAKPHRQEKLRARALHDENGRGGPMMPPGCCSRCPRGIGVDAAPAFGREPRSRGDGSASPLCLVRDVSVSLCNTVCRCGQNGSSLSDVDGVRVAGPCPSSTNPVG